MLEIKNEKSYYRSVLRVALWILAACIIMLFINPAGVVILFFIIELIHFSNRYTQHISVDDKNVKVVYYSFLSRKEIVIARAGTRSKLSKQRNLRSPGYWVLDIIQWNKRIYSVDTRDGFSEEDLKMLDDHPKVLN